MTATYTAEMTERLLRTRRHGSGWQALAVLALVSCGGEDRPGLINLGDMTGDAGSTAGGGTDSGGQEGEGRGGSHWVRWIGFIWWYPFCRRRFAPAPGTNLVPAL